MTNHGNGIGLDFRQKLVFHVPDFPGEVDLVDVGVIEAEVFIPEGGDLFLAVVPDFRKAGPVVDQLAGPEDFLVHGTDLIVFQDHPLPGVGGMEDLIGGPVGQGLILEEDEVGQGLVVLIVKTAKVLESGGGDLLHVLGDLDLGENLPILFHGHQLVDAPEDRVGLGGDEVFADTEGVQAGFLLEDVRNPVLIQGVGGDDFGVGVAGFIQHPAGLLGEVGDIPAVQADAGGPLAHGGQNLIKGPDGIGDARG